MTDRELMQMALDALELVDGYVMGKHEAVEALRAQLAHPEPEPVGNTLTFMTRAIFNIVADHQEINGGYFIADGDVAAFVDRLAKVINSTFEPLKHKGSTPPQREWVDLTKEDLETIHQDLFNMSGWSFNTMAKAIEAKLKEKNTKGE